MSHISQTASHAVLVGIRRTFTNLFIVLHA